MRHRLSSRPSILLALLVFLLSATIIGGFASTSVSAVPNPYGHSYRYCGSFRAGFRIRVYAHRVSCRKAIKIQREYWLGPNKRKVIVNGGTGAFGYVLLKRYPGWRCGSGAGGGQCSKRKSAAAYQN